VIFCIIPAKPYSEAKSRLSPALSEDQREAVSRWLLRRTVGVALQALEQVVVVSRDRRALSDAKARGATGLLEATPGLNAALAHADRFARVQGAAGVLVLPADLPRLSAADLEALLALAAAAPAAVIAPCRHGTGTNALLLRPAGLIPFAFGPGSFARHCRSARAAGVEPAVCRRAGLAFDLDTPEDWQAQTRFAHSIQAW
jgi:2-phospho-L-lactate guanylyltransferase